jgi:hypothetical protein
MEGFKLFFFKSNGEQTKKKLGKLSLALLQGYLEAW